MSEIPYQKMVDTPLSFEISTVHQPLASNRPKAILCINIFTVFQFMFMLCSKHVITLNQINGVDYLLIRSLTCLAVHAVSVLVCRQGVRFPREDLKWVLVRNAAGTMTVLTLLYALQYLPMGIYQIIYNTSPFWASLLGFLILGERLRKVEIIAMVFSFVFIILLFISRQSPQLAGSSNLGAGLLLAFTSAVCASVAAVATRRMQQVHFSVLLLHYALFSCVAVFAIVLLQSIYAWQIRTYPLVVYRDMMLSALPNALG